MRYLVCILIILLLTFSFVGHGNTELLYDPYSDYGEGPYNPWYRSYTPYPNLLYDPYSYYGNDPYNPYRCYYYHLTIMGDIAPISLKYGGGVSMGTS